MSVFLNFRFRCVFACLFLFSGVALLYGQERAKGLELRSVEDRERLILIFGEAANDVAIIEDAFERAVNKRHKNADRIDADKALERLSRLAEKRMNRSERKQLASAWRQAAALHKTHGTVLPKRSSPYWESALSLDPENESLAN